MSWYRYFKLGPLGGEIEFPCQAVSLDVNEGNVELEERNLLGASYKSYVRANVPDISIGFAQLSDGLMAILRGFQSALTPLNFIYNSSLNVRYFPATSQSTTVIVIPPSSVSGRVITEVFKASDYTQSIKNYYGVGSTYDDTTGTITLSDSLGDDQTDVSINYSFTGLRCYAKVSAKPHLGIYSGYWQGTIQLTGA